jgi:hypothetical protein
MEKGQAEIIGNILAVLFGVIILAAISTVAYNLYTRQLEDEITNNLKQMGVEVSNNILRLYDRGKNSKYSPGANESVRLAEIDLKLPSQVSGRNYEVILIEANPIWVQISNLTIGGASPPSVITVPGAKVVLRTTQSPKVTVEHEIPNIDVPIQGKSVNGLNSTLAYYRYNSTGGIKDKIVLGDFDIIIDIESVS